MHLPLLILAAFSFNQSRFTIWQGFSLAWYRAALHDSQLLEATSNSLIIAVFATVVSTVIGTLCAYGLWKRNSPALAGSLYLSLVTPEIVTGISLLAFYQWMFRFLRVPLGMHTVILAHISFSIAFVVIVVMARLRTMDGQLEEAALDLGANHWQAFRHVTLPVIFPAVIAAALLAFTVSFDDYVITSLVAGVDSETLPMVIYAIARRGVNPVVNAISALIVIGFGALILISERLRGVNRRYFLLGSIASAGCSFDRRPRLNVFNWSSYIAPDTVPKFEGEFGVGVRYGIYESNEEMLARVMGGNSGWDIVFPTNYIVQPMLANDLLAPIRRDLLTNLAQLESTFQQPEWDPQLKWSVPYMVTAAGIAYNRKLNPPPRAWADLWEERLRGRMTMLDDPFDTLGACLKKLGFSINSNDPAQLRRAQAEAIRQKPLLRAYLNAEVRDQLVSGDVLAAHMWNTTAQQAMDSSAEIGFVYPAEGYAVYPDCVVILRESKRPELAHQFINFLLRPDIAAANALAARTTTTNRGARLILPAEFRDNPTLYPAPDVVARGEWAKTLDPSTQRLRDQIWTEIKAA